MDTNNVSQQKLPAITPGVRAQLLLLGLMVVLLAFGFAYRMATGGGAITTCSTGRDVLLNILNIATTLVIAVGLRIKLFINNPSPGARIGEGIFMALLFAGLLFATNLPCMSAFFGS